MNWRFIDGKWVKADSIPREKKQEGPGRPRKTPKVTCKTCGNCKYIRYSGVNEVKMEYGTCDKYRESDRLSVKNDQEPCPLWRLRGAAKMQSEQNAAAKLKDSIGDLSSNRRRRKK